MLRKVKNISICFCLLFIVNIISAQANKKFLELDCKNIDDCKQILSIDREDLVKTFPKEKAEFKIRFKKKDIVDKNTTSEKLRFHLYETNFFGEKVLVSKVFLSLQSTNKQTVNIPFNPYIGDKEFTLKLFNESKLIAEYSFNAKGNGFLLEDDSQVDSNETNYELTDLKNFLFQNVNIDSSCEKEKQISLLNTKDLLELKIPQCPPKAIVNRKVIFKGTNIQPILDQTDKGETNEEDGDTQSGTDETQNTVIENNLISTNRVITSNISIATNDQSSKLTIAGDQNQAAIKFLESHALLQEPQDGSLEYFNGNLYFTSKGKRKFFTTNQFSPVAGGGTTIINEGGGGSSTEAETVSTNTGALAGTNLDFTNYLSILDSTLTADLTLTASNYISGHRIILTTQGNFAVNLPANFYVLNGSYDPTKINVFEFIVANDTNSSEEVYVNISQRGAFSSPPASPSPELLACGLRKIDPSYIGPAIRVRRESDDSVLDIDFNPDDSLNTTTLNNFATEVPITKAGDVASPEAVYSFRRAVTGYSGSAIRVRRGSDNVEMDIGFDGDGNLDLDTLRNFAIDVNASRTPTTSYSPGTDGHYIFGPFGGDRIFEFDITGLDGSSGGMIMELSDRFYVGFRNDGTFVIRLGNSSAPWHPQTAYLELANGSDIIQGDGKLVFDIEDDSIGTWRLRVWWNGVLVGSPVDSSTGTNYLNISDPGGYLTTTGLGSSTSGEVVNQVVTYSSAGNFKIFNNVFISDPDTYITTWYDQSGNGNDLVQASTANQPIIFDDASGIAVNSKGLAAIYFPGDSNRRLEVDFGPAYTGANSVFIAADIEDNNNSANLLTSLGDEQVFVANTLTNQLEFTGNAGGTLNTSLETINRTRIYSVISDTTDKVFINETEVFNGNAGGESLEGVYIGQDSVFSAGEAFRGKVSELIVYKSNQEANLGNILADMIPYYNINDLYVQIWYDQSGTNNHLVQNIVNSQAKIYDADNGLISAPNSRQAIRFDGVNDIYSLANFNNSTNKSIFAVASSRDITQEAPVAIQSENAGLSFGWSGASENRILLVEKDAITPIHSISSSTVSNNQFRLISGIWTGTASSLFINGSLDVSNPQTLTGTNNQTLEIGGDSGGANYASIDLSELRIFFSDQTANRTTLENEANTYFSIY